MAVAEELHFGRAAARLHIAQPGLSQQIQELERVVGVRLLDRSRRRVELTAAGKVLLEEGRRALAHVDRAIDLARRTGRGEVGRLTIASIGSATYDILPALLRACRARYPEVELVVREISSPRQAHAIRTGEIDVGLLRLPADTQDLAARIIREEGTGVFVPDGHPFATRDEISLSELADEPQIVFPTTPRPSWADFVIRTYREAALEPRIVQEAVESATVVSFVAAGVGVALVPEGLRVLARPGVEYRSIAPPAPTTSLAAVYRAGEVTGSLRALLGIIDELWPR